MIMAINCTSLAFRWHSQPLAARERTSAMNRLFLLCAFVSLFYHFANARPDGAPVGTCITMAPSVPRHGAGPQDTTAPYMIQVDKAYYNQNSTLEVSVKASGDAIIGGFLIEAREEGKDKPLGRFNMIPQLTKYLDCTSFGAEHKWAAVTQSDVLVNTKMLTFQWRPTSMTTGNIYFMATIVQNQQTYWLGVKSAVLQEMTPGMNNTTPNNMSSTSSVADSIALLILAISAKLFI